MIKIPGRETSTPTLVTALPACMVLASVVNGMPLVYSGQEAGLDRSLKFFEKDSIQWKPHPFAAIYTKLFTLKHSNQALWNGEQGGPMVRIFNGQPGVVISFSREKNGQKVLPVFNFSSKPVTVELSSGFHKGVYKELFTDSSYTLKDSTSLSLPAWGYKVLVR